MLLKLPNKSRGVGLLELMLALAVAGVLITITSRYFKATKFAQQVLTVQQEFLDITQAANRFKAVNGSYCQKITDGKCDTPVTPADLKPWLSETLGNRINADQIGSSFSGLYYKFLEVTPGSIQIQLLGFSNNADKCNKIASSIAGATCFNGNSVDVYVPKTAAP
jgi:prepilin-type N-terminal cleavage/methylation domain-containing protein